MFLLTSVSICFGHHYAHLQENKGPDTAFGVLFWFCWMWLVAVVGRCLVGCEHYEGFCSYYFCLNMFRASLCPSSGEQRPWYCIWCILVWFCWIWLVAVVGHCLVRCEYYEGFCSTTSLEIRLQKHDRITYE